MSQSLSAEEREKILSLDASATPAPWTAAGVPGWSPSDEPPRAIVVTDDEEQVADCYDNTSHSDKECAANAALIVAMRNVVPRLLDECDALAANFEQAQSDLKSACLGRDALEKLKTEVFDNPDKWMRWCDEKMREENERLTAELSVVQIDLAGVEKGAALVRKQRDDLAAELERHKKLAAALERDIAEMIEHHDEQMNGLETHNKTLVAEVERLRELKEVVVALEEMGATPQPSEDFGRVATAAMRRHYADLRTRYKAVLNNAKEVEDD